LRISPLSIDICTARAGQARRDWTATTKEEDLVKSTSSRAKTPESFAKTRQEENREGRGSGRRRGNANRRLIEKGKLDQGRKLKNCHRPHAKLEILSIPFPNHVRSQR
jgi:hypothetical protein